MRYFAYPRSDRRFVLSLVGALVALAAPASAMSRQTNQHTGVMHLNNIHLTESSTSTRGRPFNNGGQGGFSGGNASQGMPGLGNGIIPSGGLGNESAGNEAVNGGVAG